MTSTQETSSPPLRIAIIGAGLAGLALLTSLLTRNPDLDITIYEASVTLREEGAAIGLGYNAQLALSLLAPSLRTALDKAGGTPMNPSLRLMMASGPNQGEKICDVLLDKPQIVVHRTRLLKELMCCVEDESKRAGRKGQVEWGKRVKRLVEMEGVDQEGTKIEFEDGDSIVVDCVIGCDGLNSLVRREILQAQHPEVLQPTNSGTYNFRRVVPLEIAKAALGSEYCSQQLQHGWIARNGFGLTDFVNDGKAMQIIAGWGSDDPWPHEKAYVPWEKDRLRRDLEEWGDFGRRIADLFTSEGDLYATNVRRHPETPTYCRNRLCVVGDAAQAVSPALGAGAGQALEDVLILATLLGSPELSSTDVPAALEAYTRARLPRRSWVGTKSTEMSLILTGRSDAGIDCTKLRTIVEGKFDFSQPGGFNFDEMRNKALEEFQHIRTENSKT